MTPRTLHAAWLAGVSGALFPFLLVAVWGALGTMRRPMTRIGAFLDPSSVHRALDASTILFDATIGVLLGSAISLLIARMVRGDRWIVCIIFLSTFAAACVIPTALHEGWVRMLKVLAQPLLFGFVVAVVAGFWLAPRMTGSSKLPSEFRR
jgi:hypothetical protein